MMSINKYNIDEQVKLIELAEHVLDKIKRRGLSNDFEDYDSFISCWEDTEKRALKLFPYIIDED